MKQCTACHTATRIVERSRTKDEWNDVLDRMTDFGATLTDAERTAVHDYLTSNFSSTK